MQPTKCTGAELRQIVEKSAFLDERLGENFLPTNSFELSAETRLQQWREIGALDDPELFRRRLGWQGLTEESAKSVLGAVTFTDSATLPSWMHTLEKGMEAAKALAGLPLNELSNTFRFIHKDRPIAFEELLAAFVQQASLTVAANAGPGLAVVSEEAYIEFERTLLASLSGIASEVLELDLSVYRSRRQLDNAAFGWPGSRVLYGSFTHTMLSDGLLKFFLEYPVLARFIGTISNLWVESTGEFLQALANDRPALQQLFAEQGELGQVLELKPSLSDRHNGGKSSCKVRFASGVTLIYKPKNLETEEFYYRLLQWLNGKGLSLQFAIFRVLNRHTHGWVEEVAFRKCEDLSEVDRYYHRAGMLVSLLYIMEASDAHHENLIACGEYPVLIDMESLFQHRVRSLENAGDANALANELFFWDSVFRTALLPRWEFGISGESYDVSGLGGVTDHVTSFRAQVWEHVNTDAMRLRSEVRKTAPHRNVVWFGEKRISPSEYVDRIVAGFDEMYTFLMNNEDALFAAEGPLSGLAGLQVRFIYRHTKIYSVILNSLFRPQYLRDGADASIRVEFLARPLLHMDMPAEFYAVLVSEQRALLRGDIPAFSAMVDSAALIVDGHTLPGFFRESGIELVRSRFRKLDETDRATQIGFIRASFYTSVGPSSSPASPEKALPQPAIQNGKSPDEFISDAVQIANDVAAAAIRSKTSVTWLTLAYFAEAQRWQLQPMAPRFYDGVSGVALFLAAVSSVSNQKEFRDLAMGALQGTRQSLELPVYQRYLLESGIGAGLGAASVGYAFACCAHFLGDQSLLKDAGFVCDLITPALIKADTKLDLLSGAAGALLVFLKLHRMTGDEQLLEKAVLCGERLLQTRVASDSGLRAWPTLEGKLLTGLSHGAAGIACALAALYRATGNGAYLDAAREGRAYEATNFDDAVENWIDLRYPRGRDGYVFQCSWCHGAPGIALSRVGGMDALDDEGVRSDITHAINRTIKEPVGMPDHLCCGNLGRADVLLTAGMRLGRSEYVEHAMTVTSTVVDRARSAGHYLIGWDKSAFVSSFHQGMSGVGYQLLRTARPDTFHSVLLWE